MTPVVTVPKIDPILYYKIADTETPAEILINHEFVIVSGAPLCTFVTKTISPEEEWVEFNYTTDVMRISTNDESLAG